MVMVTESHRELAAFGVEARLPQDVTVEFSSERFERANRQATKTARARTTITLMSALRTAHAEYARRVPGVTHLMC